MEKSLAKAIKELEGFRQIALSERAKQQTKEEKRKLAAAKKDIRSM